MSELRPDYLAILLRSTTGTFIIRATSLAILLLTQILLARLMGASEFGLYSFVVAWIVVLARLTTGGLDTAATRFVSRYRSDKDWLSISHFRRYSENIILLLSTLTIPAFGLALLIKLNTSEISSYLIAGSLLILILATLTVRQGILQGLRYMKKSFVPDAIIRPGLLALISASLILFGFSTKANMMLYIHLLSASVALIASSVFLHHIKLDKSSSPLPEEKQQEWASVRWVLYGVGILSVAQMNLGIIILGILSDDKSVGLYSVAARIAELTSFGLITINMAFAPIASELFQKRDNRTLQTVLTRSANYGFFVAIIIGIVLLAFGPVLLSAFGREFSSAYPAMMVLVVAQIINAAAGPVAIIMMMTIYQAAALKISILSILLNIALCIALIPRYGALGAATASGIALVSWRMIALVYLYKKEHIRTWPSWRPTNPTA
ncbi:MAG: flippase [Gammaproteobacteria bacterium]|nr:flippase [Gammaproteobacteria bacterium]